MTHTRDIGDLHVVGIFSGVIQDHENAEKLRTAVTVLLPDGTRYVAMQQVPYDDREEAAQAYTDYGGEIACEFLDAAGDPIPGLTRDDCVPFTGDGVRQLVSWSGQASLPSAALGAVRLRIYLRSAQLYSYWFE